MTRWNQQGQAMLGRCHAARFYGLLRFASAPSVWSVRGLEDVALFHTEKRCKLEKGTERTAVLGENGHGDLAERRQTTNFALSIPYPITLTP